MSGATPGASAGGTWGAPARWATVTAPGPKPVAGGDIAGHHDVERLVRRFYQLAIPDPLVGAVFERFGVDWGHHVPLLVGFWAHELLGEPSYRGNVVVAHRPVLDVAPFGARELARWLELWDEAVDEGYAGPVAERAKQRARQIAAAIEVAARRRADAPADGREERAS